MRRHLERLIPFLGVAVFAVAEAVLVLLLPEAVTNGRLLASLLTWVVRR